ncbi:hypothetical protein AB0F17_55095 [Nonomuraea sp. NPDC026600]|uniref:hypothetical protein n=1 Tax=Nonomuraea sp. NPDC026600 TaxID=3155363 RepID=UPI0033F4F6A2
MKQDIKEGARLIQELNDLDFPISSALWAYMTDADEWRLVIATPPRAAAARSTTYRLIQDALIRLELSIPLSRIALVRDDDPAVQNLRALAESNRSGALGLKFGSVKISGQHVDEGYAYLHGALEYERQVLAALRRMSDLGEAYATGGSSLFTDVPAEVDFVFTNPRKIVLVEVKALARKMEVDHLRKIVAWHSRVAGMSPFPTTFLIVAKNGFTEAAHGYAQDFHAFLRLVTWDGGKDISALREGISALLNEEGEA